ncbi:MAG: DUF4976 domain-containing protein [Planctomycetota bacterium]|nr:MAG: DUF4976 domain-containing protein [Planctomycetota bacterium]
MHCCSILLLSLMTLGTRGEDAPGPIKHVVMIVSDDLKASALGCYGNAVCQTPNIDRLANRGVVFERAYCQGVVCAPSRQSFMHSRYLGDGQINMGLNFRNHGWYSARVGKIYHMKVPGDIIAGTDGRDIASSWTERFNSPGLEAHTPGDYACLNLNIFTRELEGRQSTAMPHRMFVTVQYDGDGSDQPDHKSATKAIELLETHRDESFFLAVGLIRPHYPMVAPRPFFGRYPWRPLPLPYVPPGDLEDIPILGLAATRNDNNPIGMYPDNQRRMWQGYYAAVSFMDEQVGRILDALDRLELSDSTAVVFMSDHGYHLGEHGFWQKSNLHEEVIRVPLIIAAPGFEQGRSRSTVELVDVYPTVAELAGLEIPREVQGASLVPLLENPAASVKPAALSFHKGVSYRTDRWHYMRYQDGTRELYDMRADPNEYHNLADLPAHGETLQRLDRELLARLQRLGIERALRRK